MLCKRSALKERSSNFLLKIYLTAANVFHLSKFGDTAEQQ